ncbi:MAG TPA: type II toxin-antitoxin system mRNA interferase toxin, RelE/StbE family [Patescibacteria group bacterium]|nr:type II toxin-antitoxin system mRNA interferase toxin, RelE/StbE family [Patescibacteria group bacterium]
MIKIETTIRFDRSLSKLPNAIQQETLKKVAIFRENSFDPRLRTHKLKGKLKNSWSFSINYSHRVVFEMIGKNTVLFYDIGDHRIYQ